VQAIAATERPANKVTQHAFDLPKGSRIEVRAELLLPVSCTTLRILHKDNVIIILACYSSCTCLIIAHGPHCAYGQKLHRQHALGQV